MRILAIEEDLYIRDNLRDILELEGYEVIDAADSFAKEDLPDLVICDVSLSNRDGLALLTDLRCNPKTEKLPFLFLAAQSDPPNKPKTWPTGPNPYLTLTKPFTLHGLNQAIHRLLDN